MRSFLKKNSLSLVLTGLFILSLAGQALSGWKTYNEEQQAHAQPVTDLAEYLTNDHFLEAVFENWESEFLQMAAFVVLTVFLWQKGSPESKPVSGRDDVDEVIINDDSPAAAKTRGWRLKLYENSLSLALFALFLMSFALHAVTGVGEYNQEQSEHGGKALSVLEYVSGSRFWFESFQNWQSEFLSIAVLIVFAVFLRQKGSPESKPVGASHAAHE